MEGQHVRRLGAIAARVATSKPGKGCFRKAQHKLVDAASEHKRGHDKMTTESFLRDAKMLAMHLSNLSLDYDNDCQDNLASDLRQAALTIKTLVKKVELDALKKGE